MIPRTLAKTQELLYHSWESSIRISLPASVQTPDSDPGLLLIWWAPPQQCPLLLHTITLALVWKPGCILWSPQIFSPTFHFLELLSCRKPILLAFFSSSHSGLPHLQFHGPRTGRTSREDHVLTSLLNLKELQFPGL